MARCVIVVFSVVLLCLDPLSIEAKISKIPDHRNPLVIGILQDPPFTFKRGKSEWMGMNVDLWKQVARELGVTYVFKEMKHDRIMKALENREIDLTITTVHITADREKRFEITTPFGSSRVALAVLPDKTGHAWTEAIRILFSWSTLGVIAILICILFLVGAVFWLVERRHNPDHFNEGLRGIGAGIYWVGSTLASGVCFGIPLKSLLGRFLGIIWMFTCAVALSTFVASLASSLTLKELSEASLTADSLHSLHLGTVRDDVADVITRHIGARYTLYDSEEGVLAALLDKKIDGFLFDEVTLHFYAESSYKDRIAVQPTTLKRIPFAFGLAAGSPLRKPINIAMLKIMQESVWDSILAYYGITENLEDRGQWTPRRRRR